MDEIRINLFSLNIQDEKYYHESVVEDVKRKLEIALKTLEELKELAFEDSEWHGIINKTLKEIEDDTE